MHYCCLCFNDYGTSFVCILISLDYSRIIKWDVVFVKLFNVMAQGFFVI